MRALVFFIALTFYMAVSNVDSKPLEPAPIVYVMPRKHLNFPRTSLLEFSEHRNQNLKYTKVMVRKIKTMLNPALLGNIHIILLLSSIVRKLCSSQFLLEVERVFYENQSSNFVSSLVCGVF